jgi:hypothetical protein
MRKASRWGMTVSWYRAGHARRSAAALSMVVGAAAIAWATGGVAQGAALVAPGSKPDRVVVGREARVLGTDYEALAKGRCGAIPAADVKPLLHGATLSAKVGQGGSTCEFVVAGQQAAGGDNVYIVVNVAQNAGTAQALYHSTASQDSTFGKAHRLTHVGTAAEWGARSSYEPPHPETAPPDIAAYQGPVTCTVLPPSEPQHTTLPFTMGSDGSPVITASAAATYANKEGKLCQDVFSGKMGKLRP